MKYGQWCLAVGGVSVLLIGSVAAQNAASCRKAEFRGGSPVFYYDKTCMAKIKKSSQAATSKKKSTSKSKRSLRLKAVQKLLAKRGYKTGKPDGFMGPNTSKAINSYYAKNGLKRGSGSKMNAVFAHLLKTNSKKKGKSSKAAAAKRARVAAIKKAVAAKKAAAAAKQKVAAPKANNALAKASAAAAAKRAARAAAIKKAVAAKKAAAAKQKVAAAPEADNKLATASAAAAAKRAARAAAIKKAVAAKKAAAAPKVAAKPSLYQRLKNKVVGLTPSMPKVAVPKVATPAAPKVDNSLAKASASAAAKRAARAAAIKKAVAAKKAAAKAAAGTQKVAAAPKADNSLAKASASAAAKRAARVAAIKKAVAAKKAAAKSKVAVAKVATPKVASPKAKSDGNVAELQTLLQKKGAYSGAIDGTMNIETRKSVINYYQANNVDIGDGTISQGVHKHLKSSSSASATAPKAGSVKVAAKTSSNAATNGGNRVQAIQSMLGQKGLYSGKADGLLNSPTRKAILTYYRKAKVKRGDGSIMSSVYNHLKSNQ